MKRDTCTAAVLRPKAAAEYCGLSLTTFWRLAKNDPTFPQPFKLTKATTGVLRSGLDAWLQARAGEQAGEGR